MEQPSFVKLAQTPIHLIDVMEHDMLDINKVCEAYKDQIKRMLDEATNIQNLPISNSSKLNLLEGFKSLCVGLFLMVEHIEKQSDMFLEIYTGIEEHSMGLGDVEQGHEFLISKLSSMIAIPLNKVSEIELSNDVLEQEVATASFKKITESSSVLSYLVKENTDAYTLKENLDSISSIDTHVGTTTFGNTHFQFLQHMANALSKI